MRLRQCPFCGYKHPRVEHVYASNGVDMGANIICDNCLALFNNCEVCDEEELITEWNKRVR